MYEVRTKFELPRDNLGQQYELIRCEGSLRWNVMRGRLLDRTSEQYWRVLGSAKALRSVISQRCIHRYTEFSQPVYPISWVFGTMSNKWSKGRIGKQAWLRMLYTVMSVSLHLIATCSWLVEELCCTGSSCLQDLYLWWKQNPIDDVLGTDCFSSWVVI